MSCTNKTAGTKQAILENGGGNIVQTEISGWSRHFKESTFTIEGDGFFASKDEVKEKLFDAIHMDDTRGWGELHVCQYCALELPDGRFALVHENTKKDMRLTGAKGLNAKDITRSLMNELPNPVYRYDYSTGNYHKLNKHPNPPMKI